MTVLLYNKFYTAALGVTKIRLEFGQTLLCCASLTRLFNKLASEATLLNKGSCLAATFRSDQIISSNCIEFGHTLLCYASLTRMFHKLASEAGLLNYCSCLALALGVTKFTNMRDMILVTLCCAT
jgi:hypothetical protein